MTLLEQLVNEVEAYNSTATPDKQLDLYNILDSLNNLSNEEIIQAIRELRE